MHYWRRRHTHAHDDPRRPRNLNGSEVLALIFVPLQVPTGRVTEVRKDRVDASLVGWIVQDELGLSILLRNGEIRLQVNGSILWAVIGNLQAQGQVVSQIDET